MDPVSENKINKSTITTNEWIYGSGGWSSKLGDGRWWFFLGTSCPLPIREPTTLSIPWCDDCSWLSDYMKNQLKFKQLDTLWGVCVCSFDLESRPHLLITIHTQKKNLEKRIFSFLPIHSSFLLGSSSILLLRNFLDNIRTFVFSNPRWAEDQQLSGNPWVLQHQNERAEISSLGNWTAGLLVFLLRDSHCWMTRTTAFKIL